MELFMLILNMVLRNVADFNGLKLISKGGDRTDAND